MCFALGKVINSMWILILTVQFIVYMSLWQIEYTPLLTVFFKELKRIVLAEFFDDIPIGSWFADILGMPSAGEGEADDSSQSVGPTFLVFTLIFCGLILIVAVLVFVMRKVKLSEKNRERLTNIKRTLFFNAMIRYTLLSANKLNMSAFVGIQAFSDGETSATAFSFVILVAMVVFPILYFKILYKNGSTLETDPAMLKYKTLF